MSKSIDKKLTALMRSESWQEAIDLLSGAIAESEPDFASTCDLAWCHYKLERFEAAARLFKKAVELEPEKAKPYWGVGISLAETDQLEEAAAALEKSIDIKDSPLAHMSLGLVYRMLGRFSKAVDLYQKALADWPHDPRVYITYAAFLDDTGRPDEAVIFYQRAKNLEFES